MLPVPAKINPSKSAAASRPPPKNKRLKIDQWEKMLINNVDNAVCRTPSLAPFTGAARTFVRTVELNRNDLVSDNFSIVASPSLMKTLRLPSKNAMLPLPNTWYADGGAAFAVTDDQQGGGFYLLNGGFNVKDSPTGTVIAQAAESFDPNWGPFVPINLTPASEVKVVIPTEWRSTAAVWIRIGGLWVHQVTLATTVLAEAFSPSGIADGISFGLGSPSGTGAYSVTMERGPIATANPSFNQQDIHDLFQTDVTTIARLGEYRVTALSLLVSSVANVINTGGVIAGARVRPHWYPTTTVYQALTQLQDHSYRGPLKDGAYVWWLPYDIQEMDFDTRDSAHQTRLVVAGEFADPDAVLQITVALTVEFYSPLQIFEHEVGPPLTDDFVKLYHGLDRLPAASCNPLHDNIVGVVGKLMKGAGSTAKGVANASVKYLLDHPEIIAGLLAGLL